LQQMFQLVTPIFGGHKIQISQPINMLVATRSNIAIKCVVLRKNGALRVKFLVVDEPLPIPSVHPTVTFGLSRR
jgi:hypothetical protein